MAGPPTGTFIDKHTTEVRLADGTPLLEALTVARGERQAPC